MLFSKAALKTSVRRFRKAKVEGGWGTLRSASRRYEPQRIVPTSARSKKERRLCGARATEGRLGNVTTRLLLEHDEQRKSVRAACRGRQNRSAQECRADMQT